MVEEDSRETRTTAIKIASLEVKGTSLARTDERYIEIIAAPSEQPLDSLSGSAYRFYVERSKILNGNAMFLIPGSEIVIEHRGDLDDKDRELIALHSVPHDGYEGPEMHPSPFYRF